MNAKQFLFVLAVLTVTPNVLSMAKGLQTQPNRAATTRVSAEGEPTAKRCHLWASRKSALQSSDEANEKFDLPSGCYKLQARFGETEIQAQLKLEHWQQGCRGQLTLSLGMEMHVALRAVEQKKRLAVFRASSPVTEVRLETDGELLTGSVVLHGNRSLDLKGSTKRIAELPADFSQPFDLEPFESGTISTDAAGQAFITFTPDAKQLFLGQYQEDFLTQKVLKSVWRNGSWTQPKTASFSGQFSDRSPMLSLDGTKLVFASTRPLPGQQQPTEYNLWIIHREQEGQWGKPRPLSNLNSEQADYQPSFARDGTIYFSSKRDGNQDLYRARIQADGTYAKPEKFGDEINGPHDEMGCCISPDQDFLIFTTTAPHQGHIGDDDLYVSFASSNGWTEPRNLGSQVNSFANEYAPVLSPDAQYLYFASDRLPPANIYRIKVDDIRALSPEHPNR